MVHCVSTTHRQRARRAFVRDPLANQGEWPREWKDWMLKGTYWIVLLLILMPYSETRGQETYRGIVVAPERRCAPYERSDYPYPQTVEADIVVLLGKIYGPYTGRCFASARETDIEHMISLSEAHDSGLCAADFATKAAFSRDILNLTLAAPELNRYVKGARDAAEWMPQLNRCWFAARTLEVRRKYGLSIDRREAEAVERTLARCPSTRMVIVDCDAPEPGVTETPAEAPGGEGERDALARWDDNGNGRITCAEARKHGIAPVPRNHPAYRYMRDGDGDGVVCE